MDDKTKGTLAANNKSEKTSEYQTFGDDKVDFHFIHAQVFMDRQICMYLLNNLM